MQEAEEGSGGNWSCKSLNYFPFFILSLSIVLRMADVEVLSCVSDDGSVYFTHRLGVRSLSSAAKITTFLVPQQERAWRTSPGVELNQSASVRTDCLLHDAAFNSIVQFSFFC